MAERDPFDRVEMSPGAQPPAGFGDRVLVGLALIALLAGAVIAVANFIPDRDEVARASIDPSAEPSGTPRPPTPSPPRVATIQDPDIIIPPADERYGFDGWIRASVDLAIWPSASFRNTSIGLLKQGEVAYASQNEQPDQEPGWLYLQDHLGWVATKADGQELARRYEHPQVRGSGWIDSLTTGPDGFLAMITPPGGPLVYGPPRPAISADGTTWRSAAATAFDGQWVGTVAHGPSGWLAAGGVNDGSAERILLWGSPDGLSWSRLGMLSGLDQAYVGQLLGSETEYVLETQSNRGLTTLWVSADGLTWIESAGPPTGYGDNGYRRTAAVAGGFYSWGDRATGAFSADGLTWSSADDGPDGLNLRLADLQGRVVAIDLDRGTLVPRVWSGFIARGRLGWQRLEQSDHFFADAVVTQLVSDGRRLFAFGWDRSTEEPLVWTGDGVGWARSPLPEAFGGLPMRAAAGRNGVVALGYRRTLRGDNPIAWHRTAVGGWLPESDPLLALAPDPAGNECPALPADLLEFSVVDAAAVVSCHGDAPVTFEGLSVPCDGCAWTADGDPQPAWLMNPYTNVLYMTPIETDSGWQTTLILGPSLTLDPAWVNHRLRITGHFDDPAALTCHQDVNADSVEWWTGQESIINGCRQSFVVTDVTVLPGP